MRAILLDWLVDVHRRFRLRDETLYFSVNLIDRFLSKTRIRRQQLQLIGVAAMLIASKFEEIHPPQVHDFEYITDNVVLFSTKAFSKRQILEAEQAILLKMEWELCFTSSWVYLQRYAEMDALPSLVLNLARYFIEECFLHYKMVSYTQHMLACSALYLAKRFRKLEEPWPAQLAEASGLQEAQLKICTKNMCLFLRKSRKETQLGAVKRKFATEEFDCVALLPELSLS